MPPRFRILAALLVTAAPLAAQQWVRGDSLPLIGQAVARRVARDADTLVASWQATAHGLLRYASVFDQGGVPVERVVRADELQVEVYGEAPNRSKQIIRAWRDTSFLPNALVWHRDHLGIVANDFGAFIRLGQGEEVRDVPHPLSPAGITQYRFLIGDTLVLRQGDHRTRTVAVQVAPIDADSPATVGTLFLDIDRAELVRFNFTFTAASYRDHTVESITVALDNALQLQSHWLPWHQTIVIARGQPIFDIAMRTVIRADWTISDYALGVHHPPDRFEGRYIDGPAQPFAGGSWSDAISDQLHDAPATTADLDAVMAQAEQALHGRSVSGLPRTHPFGRGISDYFGVNRVSGVVPGMGLALGLPARSTLDLHGRYGLTDHRVQVRTSLGVPIVSWHVGAQYRHELQDVGDQQVISGLSNTVSTLLANQDLGDYFLLDRAALTAGHATPSVEWQLSLGREKATSVAASFRSIDGTAPASNPPLGAGAVSFIRLRAGRPPAAAQPWEVNLEVASYGIRTYFAAQHDLSAARTTLELKGSLGLSTGALPAYRSFVLGGWGTLPGVPFRSLGGARMVYASATWTFPVRIPTFTFPMLQHVALPSAVGPFVAAGSAGGRVRGDVLWSGDGRIEAAAGGQLDLWGPMLRVQAGISLRTGKAELTIDVHPQWWPLM